MRAIRAVQYIFLIGTIKKRPSPMLNLGRNGSVVDEVEAEGMRLRQTNERRSGKRSKASTVPRRLCASLARPQPAEGAGGQQAINESVDHFLDREAPGLPLPDAVAQVPKSIGEESGCARDSEDS